MKINTVINSEGFLKEISVLKISSLVSWKRSNAKYNFNVLPKTAILTLSRFAIARKTRFLSKKTKGLIGQNFILNRNAIFCSEFGNGSPAIIGFLEELHELGVENFLFVGLAGLIDDSANRNHTFLVNNSFSTVGVTSFYSAKDNFEPVNNVWFKNLKTTLNLPDTTCWSTDAPFRETQSLLSYFIQKKATHVDMECAAIYAFAEFYSLNALCIIITADDLSSYNWNSPKDIKATNLNLKQIIKKLIKINND
jgi:purine-nucleoside phosphorylase